MKITDVKTVLPSDRSKPGDTSAVAAPTRKDRVSVQATKEAKASVAAAQQGAAGHRSERLAQLESQVRSGGYHPDPSSVAEQILSDAEVDARLAALLQR